MISLWFGFAGRGWVVPVVYLTAAFAGLALTRALGVEKGHWSWELWGAFGFFSIAIPILYLNARWTRLRGRLVWDSQSARLIRLPAGNTFLWLDVKIWGWIFLGAGVAKLVGLT